MLITPNRFLGSTSNVSTSSLAPEDSDIDDVTTEESHEELRAMLVVMRHGDRTPKQKLKMVVKDQQFLRLLTKYESSFEYPQVFLMVQLSSAQLFLASSDTMEAKRQNKPS